MTHPIDCFVPVGNAPQQRLGAAIQCAKGVVLPANFMQSGQTNPLPKAKPAAAPAKTETKSVLPWVIGAAAVGGLAWLAWSSGGLAGLGVAANPKEVFVAKAPGYQGSIEADTVDGAQYHADQKWPRDYEVLIRGEYTSDGTHWGKGRGRAVAVREQGRWRRFAAANPVAVSKAASTVWEQAYREALREGLKKGEAEEYAQEVLRAYQDDELNRLGGALGSEEYANPAPGPRPARAGPWQVRPGRLDSTDSRVRFVVFCRAADEPASFSASFATEGDANDWAKDNCRQYRVEPWPPRANPGRAQKLGLRPSDFDPKELARGTKHELEHTDSESTARRITMDHLAETWERAYRQARKSGASDSAARARAFAMLKRAKYYGPLDEMEKLQGEEERLYALERSTFRNNPNEGPPYTIEEENTLLGHRSHRKASPYPDLTTAEDRAKTRASQVRKFVTVNVLDRRGNVVASHKGVL